MKNPYEKCPEYENENWLLRLVKAKEALIGGEDGKRYTHYYVLER